MGKPAMGLNTYMAISFDFSLKKAISANSACAGQICFEKCHVAFC